MSKTFAVSRYGGGSSSSADRHPAGLEVALELRAKRTNLVRLAERIHALIKAALRCRPMLIERALGARRYRGRDGHSAGRGVRARRPSLKRGADAVLWLESQPLALAPTITTAA
jgi:hypothetical protein